MNNTKESSNKDRHLTEITFLASYSTDGYDLYKISENDGSTTVRNLREISPNIYTCRYEQRFLVQ